MPKIAIFQILLGVTLAIESSFASRPCIVALKEGIFHNRQPCLINGDRFIWVVCLWVIQSSVTFRVTILLSFPSCTSLYRTVHEMNVRSLLSCGVRLPVPVCHPCLPLDMSRWIIQRQQQVTACCFSPVDLSQCQPTPLYVYNTYQFLTTKLYFLMLNNFKSM